MFIYDNDRDKIFCLLMIKRKVLKGVDIVEIYGVVWMKNLIYPKTIVRMILKSNNILL